MNPTALEVLIDVIRTGSLTAVARERRLTPSTISRIVAALESEVGTRLLHRTTRRVTPTDAALALIENTKPHLEALRCAVESVRDTSGKLSGVLRVTASTSFGIHRLAPLMTDFSRKHPDLKLDLHLTDAIVDLIAQRFDVAIRHGALKDSSLIAQRLLKVRYAVCASPGYLRRHRAPRDLDELADHRCLVFPMPNAPTAWRFARQGAVRTIALSSAIAVNSGLVLRQCALDGAGLVLLSDWLIGDDLKAGRLIDVFPGLAATPTNFQPAISAVYRSRQVPAKVKTFVHFLRKRLAV